MYFLIINLKLFIVTSRQTLNSILYLILYFVSVSTLLFYWKLQWLALIIAFIYIGSIIMLFLFILMLIPYSYTQNLIEFRLLFSIIFQAIFIELVLVLSGRPMLSPFSYIKRLNFEEALSYQSYFQLDEIGYFLIFNNSYYIIICSILLLIGMIGSIVVIKD